MKVCPSRPSQGATSRHSAACRGSGSTPSAPNQPATLPAALIALGMLDDGFAQVGLPAPRSQSCPFSQTKAWSTSRSTDLPPVAGLVDRSRADRSAAQRTEVLHRAVAPEHRTGGGVS